VPWNSSLAAGYTLWPAFVILWNVTERRSVRTGAALVPPPYDPAPEVWPQYFRVRNRRARP